MAKFPSVRVGVCEGAKCGEIFSPATCEVLFGSAPAGEGAEAHDLKPGEVYCASAWAKARRPAGPQPGFVAMCSSVRVGVGKGLVA